MICGFLNFFLIVLILFNEAKIYGFLKIYFSTFYTFCQSYEMWVFKTLIILFILFIKAITSRFFNLF